MTNCYNKELTEMESDLIDMFRILSDDSRCFIFDSVHRSYTRLVERGTTSIRLINVFRHEQALKETNYQVPLKRRL